MCLLVAFEVPTVSYELGIAVELELVQVEEAYTPPVQQTIDYQKFFDELLARLPPPRKDRPWEGGGDGGET